MTHTLDYEEIGPGTRGCRRHDLACTGRCVPRRRRAPAALRAVAAALLAGAAGGCTTTELPFIYRLDVQQGNVLDNATLAQLEPGMDQRRVSFILGTPLISDPFNADRWDYYYSLRQGTRRRDQRTITLLFEQGRLKRIVGDVRPGEPGQLAEPPPEQVVDVPPAEPQGLVAALTPGFLKSEEAKRQAEAQARLREFEDELDPAAQTAEPAEPTAPPDETETARQAAAAPASAAADARYFDRLFAAYGDPSAGGTARLPALPGETPGSGRLAEDETPSSERDAEVEGETYFQRLARRFREDQEKARERQREPRDVGDR